MVKFKLLMFSLVSLNLFSGDLKIEQLIGDCDFTNFIESVRPQTLSVKEIENYQKIVNKVLKEKVSKKDFNIKDNLTNKKTLMPALKIAGSVVVAGASFYFINDVWNYYDQDTSALVISPSTDKTVRVTYLAAGCALLTSSYLAIKSILKNIGKISNQKNKDIKNLFLIHMYLQNLK